MFIFPLKVMVLVWLIQLLYNVQQSLIQFNFPYFFSIHIVPPCYVIWNTLQAYTMSCATTVCIGTCVSRRLTSWPWLLAKICAASVRVSKLSFGLYLHSMTSWLQRSKILSNNWLSILICSIKLVGYDDMSMHALIFNAAQCSN